MASRNSKFSDRPDANRRKIHEDSYFDDDESENVGAAAAATQSEAVQQTGVSDEPDPLDAFMDEINADIASSSNAAGGESAAPQSKDDDDDDDVLHHGGAATGAGPGVGSGGCGVGDAAEGGGVCMAGDYDSDDEVYAAAARAEARSGISGGDGDGDAAHRDKRKGPMEELAPVDHTTVQYDSVRFNFYDEHPEVFSMSEAEAKARRKELDVRIVGENIPMPIRTWEHCGFEPILAGELRRHKYEAPTPIQCAALPIALSGRDIIGIAQTGSGKTAAYILPMVVHVMDQPELKKKDGPIGLVLSPTRELCQQIHVEAKRFVRGQGARVCVLYGGIGKNDQRLDLLKGCEILVSTPGRLIDMIKGKATRMNRVTMVVLDEADRMFSLGFEPQIRSVMGQVNPDRQTLLFSATFAKKVESLARATLRDPVRITVGSIGEASDFVTQRVVVLGDQSQKWGWLTQMVPNFVKEGSVLIFVSTRVACEELATNLKTHAGWSVQTLHGDKDQMERDRIFRDFKRGALHIVIATDIAARGLDVKTIRNVVCFDAAKDKDSHTHRIGRTGRAGETGDAWILLTPKDKRQAGYVVHSLQEVQQVVPPEVLHLAQQDPDFSLHKRPDGGRGGRGGGGGGRGGKSFGVGFGKGGGGGGGGSGGAAAAPVFNPHKGLAAANIMGKFQPAGQVESTVVGGITYTTMAGPVASAPKRAPPPPPKPLGADYYLEKQKEETFDAVASAVSAVQQLADKGRIGGGATGAPTNTFDAKAEALAALANFKPHAGMQQPPPPPMQGGPPPPVHSVPHITPSLHPPSAPMPVTGVTGHAVGRGMGRTEPAWKQALGVAGGANGQQAAPPSQGVGHTNSVQPSQPVGHFDARAEALAALANFRPGQQQQQPQQQQHAPKRRWDER